MGLFHEGTYGRQRIDLQPGDALVLFSDGLSSLSLFVEPLDGEGPVLAPGMHRLGISYAAVRHLELGGSPMQVVAMGELPPRVLLKVVEEVEWRDRQATAEEAP